MQDGDTYRLLTQEDAEWEKDYRTRLAAVRDDATRMSQLRSERLTAAVEAALGNLKPPRREQDPPQARRSLGAGRTHGQRRWRPRVDAGRVVDERIGREESRRRGR